MADSQTGSVKKLLNGKSRHRESSGHLHIIDHARLRPVTANTARRRRLSKSKMAAIKPEVEITFERWVMAPPIPTPTLYLRPCPNRIWHCRHCPTSPTTEIQDGGHRNRKWKWLLNRMSFQSACNGNPRICDPPPGSAVSEIGSGLPGLTQKHIGVLIRKFVNHVPYTIILNIKVSSSMFLNT